MPKLKTHKGTAKVVKMRKNDFKIGTPGSRHNTGKKNAASNRKSRKGSLFVILIYFFLPKKRKAYYLSSTLASLDLLFLFIDKLKKLYGFYFYFTYRIVRS